MLKLISEMVKVDQGFAPADIATDTTSLYFFMANYRQVQAIVNVNTVADTKNVVVQLMQATDSAGTGAKVLGDAVTQVAGTGGTKMNISVESDASLMDTANGFTHVAVKVTSDTVAALLAAAAIIRGNGRYGTSQA